MYVKTNQQKLWFKKISVGFFGVYLDTCLIQILGKKKINCKSPFPPKKWNKLKIQLTGFKIILDIRWRHNLFVSQT